MNNNLIFLSRMKIQNQNQDNILLDDKKIDFLEYIWNTYCIYYSHQNENNLYFYRIKSKNNEEKPTLFLDKNSKEIKYIKNKDIFGYLLYSFNDFLNADTIEEIEKKDNVFRKIEKDLKKLQEKFYNDELEKQSVIITNEGAGKSILVLNQIKKGEIYTAPDREILKEKEKFLKRSRNDFIRFHSNADIIYTTVLETRNNRDIAKEISTKYLDSCQNLDKKIDKNTLSDELMELSTKELSFIQEEISKFKNEDMEIDKENSSISLIQFLKNNTDLTDDEKEIIIEYYNYLTSILVKGTKVITCTTHKLKILLQKMKYNRKLLVYCDEIMNDIHGNAQVLNKNIIKPQTYNFISMITKLKETKDTEISEELQKKIEKMKTKRNAKNWHILSSYFNFQSLIEIKNNNWIYNNDAYFIILTTEEKAKIIFPDAIFYDYRHHIYEKDNINIICIDNFNSSIKEEKLFKGHERPLIVKSCAETIFNIPSQFYIGDGIGHSLETNLPNIHNIRGTNTLYKAIKEDRFTTIKNIGIALTNPHPENINLHKALLYSSSNELQKISKDSIDFLMQEKEDDIIKIIFNDQFHQTVGRINGYRKLEHTKTFVIVNSRLLSKLNPYYITKNIFHLSNFLNQKYFREKYPDIYSFLVSVNLLLNLKTNRDRNHKEEQLKLNEYIKFIIEKTNIKKYVNITKEFLYSISKKFSEHCEIYLKYINEKINKIKYIFHIIKDLSERFRYHFKSCHMKLNNKIRMFIVKSKIVENKKKFSTTSRKNSYRSSSFILNLFHMHPDFEKMKITVL